jgi:hypothetical protein
MPFSSTIKREQDEFHLLVFPRLIFVILWTDASHSWTKRSEPVIGARCAEVDAYLGTLGTFRYVAVLFHCRYVEVAKPLLYNVVFLYLLSLIK